jgi:hypothetical protein
MNSSHCSALRRRRRGEAVPSGEAASWLHCKGKVWSIAASLDAAKPKLLLSGAWHCRQAKSVGSESIKKQCVLVAATKTASFQQIGEISPPP